MVTHHPAALFCGHKHCGIGDTTVFVFHVNLTRPRVVTLWVEIPHAKSSTCQVWWSQALW